MLDLVDGRSLLDGLEIVRLNRSHTSDERAEMVRMFKSQAEIPIIFNFLEGGLGRFEPDRPEPRIPTKFMVEPCCRISRH